MRLVRDDDLMEVQEPTPADPKRVRSRQNRQETQPTDEAPDQQGGDIAQEQPDGVVDTADETDSGPDAAIAVDLRSLEALLLSTHHPLTAGRLAELLDLPAAKPIRRAVSQLNDQYADSGRSF